MGLIIPGYTLFCRSITDGPRTFILARNMNIWILPGSSSRDLVAVQIKYYEGKAERSLVLCSAYLPFDSKDLPPEREFEELVRYCEEKTLSLIVGHDSNCHHTVWGSTNCNDRGVALVGFLNSTDLEILNHDNDPTFCNSQRLEVTDILGSFALLESIKDWKVSSEPSLSDQRHILSKLVGSVPEALSRDSRSNWNSFREDRRGRLEQGPRMDLKDEAGLGLTTSYVQEALITAYEDNCLFKIGRKGKCSLMWKSNLESLRREVRQLFNKGRRTGTPRSWELYKEAQRRYRKKVRNASTESWRVFGNSINDLPMSARLHKALSRDPKIRLSSPGGSLGTVNAVGGESL
jgi:hypothetical protein